jgi:hypothetical protein
MIFAVASELPAGVSIDRHTGVIHGTVQENKSGQGTILVTACEPCAAVPKVRIATCQLNVVGIQAPGFTVSNVEQVEPGVMKVTLKNPEPPTLSGTDVRTGMYSDLQGLSDKIQRASSTINQISQAEQLMQRHAAALSQVVGQSAPSQPSTDISQHRLQWALAQSAQRELVAQQQEPGPEEAMAFLRSVIAKPPWPV